MSGRCNFLNAFSVVTTVVSRRPGAAIVDGGYEAFSTDRPFTPVAKGLEGVTYAWAGDDHGSLDLSNAQGEVKSWGTASSSSCRTATRR